MIYAILKVLSRLTIWGYFRKVKIVGKEHIPKNGPYIFVANHPSAFMDPIVVATSIKQPVYFIAAGEYVGKGFKGYIFQKLLHMIPVFRPDTRPEEAHKNKDMFVKCYEHLSKKGSLLIFPEGVSLTEKKLKPLKTGTIRIAIGAEQMNAFKLGLPIIPIGLNYSDPHTFRSDLFVKIGAPLYINEHLTPETIADKESQIEKTKELTAILQDKMQQTVLHINTAQEELMLEKLEKIFSKTVKTALEIDFNDQEGEFEVQKNFVAAISYFKQSKPIIYAATEDKIDHYLTTLTDNNLTDRDIGEFKSRYKFKRVISFILGAPYYLFGLIHNIIPYRLVGFFAKKINMGDTFSGSISLAIGLFTFLFWYIGISFLVGALGLGWIAIFYVIPMYVTGLYALIYNTAIKNSVQRKNLRKVADSNTAIITTLIGQRKEIVSIIKACQEDYLKQLD